MDPVLIIVNDKSERLSEQMNNLYGVTDVGVLAESVEAQEQGSVEEAGAAHFAPALGRRIAVELAPLG